MKQPKIYYHSIWILPPPPRRAITLPPWGIFIKKKYKSNQKILNHELIHWQQYQIMGLFKFYFQYLKEFLIYGYKKNAHGNRGSTIKKSHLKV